jgi:hypothetical protein
MFLPHAIISLYIYPMTVLRPDLSSARKNGLETTVLITCAVRVREILISIDFVAFYFTAHGRRLRKVPREFFKL